MHGTYNKSERVGKHPGRDLAIYLNITYTIAKTTKKPIFIFPAFLSADSFYLKKQQQQQQKQRNEKFILFGHAE